MSPLLLTPGPLTTSDQTRAALGRDWGSRDADFTRLSEGVRSRLAALAGVAATHVAVPIQGSGTFAVEAAVQTLLPRGGRLLVLINGAYGRRIVDIAQRLGRACVALEAPENQPILPERVAQALADDPSITDVMLIHCETTSGLLNPLPAIAACVRDAGRRLLVDAMSSFGAVPIDGASIPFTALIGSSNKGLEGVPGLSFVIAETAYLATCKGNSTSVSLDLFDQWRGFAANGQWRFTPPVQVVAGLSAALDQLAAEGGIAARHARYRQNCDVLVAGMRARGFSTYIEDALQAPVIVTFQMPAGSWFDFQRFYDFLHARGIVIYPGKLTQAPSFRIGCIGAITPDDMRRALREIDAYLAAHRPVQSAA
jgi:2-aminoethylphosphonate-pyruvate transaminase